MSTPLSAALAVKELESGEFHWILMDETLSSDDLISYMPQKLSKPYRNAEAAWAAGYLMVRATLRKAASGQ
jgi:hypothetical protein